ncbi:MAG: VWA domain-containing protein [Planctomycetes bacterium]|nr:VWA domain-containing protein [Planctomycetota bacterium]
MPFLYPIYLLGTVFAGIPIIIHMIHRRKAPKVLFPTLRFLRASNERTSRRQRIQDLLLLLLRILLFVLLAFALAQPFLGSRRWGLGQRIHAVIVLDNSYSMGTEHERKARFAAAKDLASAALESLPPLGSQAAVLLSVPPHGYPRPFLTADREALRRDILKAPLSQGRADMTAAVQQAYDLLAEGSDSKAPTMEIYAVTDMQRNAWTAPRPLEDKHRSPQPALIVVDVGRTDYRNLGVADLAVHGGARVRARPVTIQAKVRNYAHSKATVNVTCYVDQAKQANQQLEIPPDLVMTASFNHVFAEPGIHNGWVQIDDDSLALDNRRDFSIEIQDHLPALVVRDAVPAIAQLDPSFYVAKALDPFGDDPGKPRSLVQTTITELDKLTHDLLQKFRVVVLVDPGALQMTQIAVLRQYVRRGGRLVVFPGPNLRPRSLTDFLRGDKPADALMPVELGEPAQGLIDRKKFDSLVGLDERHTILNVFRGYHSLPQAVKVYNHVPINAPERLPAEERSPVQLLIGLSSGDPFLLENRFHEGRVLLFSTCTDPDWSNLAASRFFLPLLHRIVYYLTEREDIEGTHLVGSPVNINLRDVLRPVTVQVRDPAGEIVDLPAKPEPASGLTRATFPRTDRRGPYVYLVLDPARAADRATPEARAEAERGFVVNPDPQEGDLARTSESELRKLLDGHALHYVGPPEQASPELLRAAVEKIRQGVPLRDLILYVVLFIAIFETFFANRVVPAFQRAEERRTAAAGA